MPSIVREKGRKAKTGISRRQWDRLEEAGRAPKRVRMSAACVGWIDEELDAWVAERIAERDREVCHAAAP